MNKKTLFITSRGLIRLDENLEPVGVNSDREAIEYVVRIDEPMHIVYNKNNKHIELDAEEGDILIVFYESEYQHPMVLVHSKEWAENIEGYRIAEQKRKEEWAKNKKSQCDECCDCGTCTCCPA